MTVQERLQEHFDEALSVVPKDRLLGVFLQGSQNYTMDLPHSDVDSKAIVLPSLDELVCGAQPMSYTYIRANDEHIDFKDIRNMFKIFKNQNMNFLEILFSKYFVINPLYEKEWNEIVANREKIARYNIYNSVKAMKGVALEKYHAMEHHYPAKAEIIDAFGYDCKQLHHMLRVEEFIRRYIKGEPYEKCLIPNVKSYLLEVKQNKYNLEDARKVGEATLERIESMCKPYTKDSQFNENHIEVEELLDRVQTAIIEKSLILELERRKMR